MAIRHGLAAALILLAIPAAAQQATDPAPPKVTVTAAYSREITQEVSFIGRGEAIDKVDLVARVSGFLQEARVENGAEVAAGDVLFRIEPDTYQAAVAAREADLASARASLELAGIELRRTDELVQRGSSPQSELDVARADQQSAEAAVKAADAALRQAELDLGYTDVIAPFDGRVGRIDRSVGDLVGPTTGPLVTLVREAPIFVAFSLSERQMVTLLQEIQENAGDDSNMADGPAVHVTLPNGTDLGETGTIAFADNRVDPTTGTVTIRAEFANTDRLIFDGAFLTVRIEARAPVERLLVPQASVQRDQQGDFVLVVNAQGMVEQRYVTTGDTVETDMIVTDGLREGEQVIVDGLQRVRPGVPVDAVIAGSPVE
jgi:RND family efflux transporter MFP subunit